MTSDSPCQIDDEQALNEIVHWLVLTAAHDPALRAVKGKYAIELADNEFVRRLEQSGCDKTQLINVLAFANKMPDLYPPLDAQELRELAKDLKSVFSRMKRMTPSIAVPWAKDDAGNFTVVTLKPTGGDLHIWPWLEDEVQCRLQMYEQLARLCSERRIPSRASFRKFAYIWPVQFVVARTGKPHYADLSALLALTGIDKGPKQLKVSFNLARTKFPSILNWMDLATRNIHGEPGE